MNKWAEKIKGTKYPNKEQNENKKERSNNWETIKDWRIAWMNDWAK